MTVFKTYWKIVNKYKLTIILYTVILIIFAGTNLKTSDTNTQFVASKPDLLIINNDEKTGLTENLINYLETNSNIIDIKNNEDAINDALFYRDVNYIIYIPEGFRHDFMKGLNPEINIKSTGDYQSSLAEMLVTRYIKVANSYLSQTTDEKELISKITKTLHNEVSIEITSKIDNTKLSKACFYYNFLNYSILAGLVYTVCLVLITFREEKISKRTIISSINYQKYNHQLLLSNFLLSIILWFFFIILSFFLVGDIMFTIHGLILILNSFVFSFCALCLSFLIANIISNKNAINGLVNVIGLGSSFLCGAFVPTELLPDNVLKIAHILPSYWFIKTNEFVGKL